MLDDAVTPVQRGYPHLYHVRKSRIPGYLRAEPARVMNRIARGDVGLTCKIREQFGRGTGALPHNATLSRG